MEKLKEYLKRNKIKFEELSETTVRVDDKTYELIYPDNQERLFDDSFEMTCDDTVEDNYVFSFGGNYYWTPKGTETDPQLNEFRYLGISSSDLKTDSFLGIRGEREPLNGSRLYKYWCLKARFLGITSLGLCEKNTLAGTLKFQLECSRSNIKSIIGATYTVFREQEDLRYDVKIYVKNSNGWQNLLLINKEINVTNRKFIKEERLVELLDDLYFIVDPKSLDFDKINKLISSKINYYQLDTVEYVSDERDKYYLENLKKYVSSKLQPISITDAFYLEPEQSYIKKILNSISGIREYESLNQYFKDKEDYFNELEKLFNIEDDSFYDILNLSIQNEKELVDQCNFKIVVGEKFIPLYVMSDSEKVECSSNEDLFLLLIKKGIEEKVDIKDRQKYLDRVEYEYDVIKRGGFIDYFLILWDIIKWCREKEILTGVGRGSAAGCLISYLLDITRLDPLPYNLLFERFLNEGRIGKSLPDIDTDFPASRREEVKQYMEERYGREQVCSVGTFTTLQMKAAIKDLCRVMTSINPGELNMLTSRIDFFRGKGFFVDLFKTSVEDSRLRTFIRNESEVVNAIPLCLELPKSESVHPCATLILPSEKTVFQWLPIKKIIKDSQEVLVTEWEGEVLEAAGFLKEDILGIKQLDKFQDILDLIKINHDDKIDIYHLPLDNKKVYEFFKKGWNGDVFHFGSKGLTGYCREILPESIEDLIAAISLYRPGGMELGFHTEYVLRKRGKKEVEYLWGTSEITKETYGIIIYQEQIMQICRKLAGYSLVEADEIRKALGKTLIHKIKEYRESFVKGSVSNGCDSQVADDIWSKLEKFAKYCFNKSHALAYSVTGYISQWLKVNYPIEFWSVAFKYASADDYPNYISEINKVGDIRISPAEINKSQKGIYSDYDTNTIYWSITSVKQAGEISQQQIEEDKKLNGHYFSFEEFLSRHVRKGSKVTKQIIENLVLSGVFDEIEEIKQPKDRIRLINFYRKEYKIKIDKEKDQFTTNEDSIDTNWWWSLQQKKICGFSLFEFDLLCETYLAESVPYYDAISIDEEKEKKEITTGGYLNEMVVRNGKKGEYAELTLDNNFEFITVKIWQDEWKKVKPMLDGKEKVLVLLSGTVDYDNWKKKNVLYMNQNSSICVLE